MSQELEESPPYYFAVSEAGEISPQLNITCLLLEKAQNCNSFLPDITPANEGVESSPKRPVNKRSMQGRGVRKVGRKERFSWELKKTNPGAAKVATRKYLVRRSRTCCLRLGMVVRASTIVHEACLAAWVAGVNST